MSARSDVETDIAICIEDCDEAELLLVLCESLGDAVRVALGSVPEDERHYYQFSQAYLVLEPSRPSGFGECWLRGELPWPDSVIFGRAMASRLGRRVFCDPGAHYPEVHPASDAFLLVDADGERIVDIEEIEEQDDT